MPRKQITEALKDALHKEYNHRCAICGSDNPHIHHIDEDPSNNDINNLLPLCPNCHLTDQHNPTRKIEIEKLKLFRQYRDPAILKPQFHPIYTRQLFLYEVEINEDGYKGIQDNAKELVEFVSSLEMGNFYGQQINKLIMPKKVARVRFVGGGCDYEYEQLTKRLNCEYRQKLIDNKNRIQYLLVELLRYQPWVT